MDSSAFRRDPYLRSSAYHLATWSLAAFMVEVGRQSIQTIDGANAAAAIVVLLGGSALSSMTHERRLGKMAGPAGTPVWAGAGRLWLVLLSGLGAASLVLALGELAALLFPLWAVAVGTAFSFWGRKASFPRYRGLGLCLVGAGLLDVALATVGGPAGPFRIFVLGLALPAFALATNRRLLWFRPEES